MEMYTQKNIFLKLAGELRKRVMQKKIAQLKENNQLDEYLRRRAMRGAHSHSPFALEKPKKKRPPSVKSLPPLELVENPNRRVFRDTDDEVSKCDGYEKNSKL